MTSYSIISWFGRLKQVGQRYFWARAGRYWPERPTLHYWAENTSNLPDFVQQSPVAMRYLQLLGPLVWDGFPDRPRRLNGNSHPVSYAAFAAACLVKVDQQIVSMGALRRYLIEHPALVWLLGFPVIASAHSPWGFDVQASLPTHRHFTRMLRKLPNSALQFLLDSSVTLLKVELAELGITLGISISLDTKHIIAWVRENNPKDYVQDRYDRSAPSG